jgi:hypothetical protein
VTGFSVPVAIAGTGVHLPPQVVTNAELASTLDTSDEWIVSRTRHPRPALPRTGPLDVGHVRGGGRPLDPRRRWL